MKTPKTGYVMHLLPNAHIDSVWLWDWREGMNENLATVRSVLSLMRQYPELTFIRGEASGYQYIEKHEPAIFAEIKKMVKAGRWEIVGGTYVQSDTNMTGTETLARQFCTAQSYFQRTFGVRAAAAWWPDSFGHSIGLPTILADAGIEYLAVSRPFPGDLPLPKPAFWWQAPDGRKILTYRMPVGWYGTERPDMASRLEAHLAAAPEHGLQNIGVFIGMGNHGGGPCAQQLDELAVWRAAHPEVTVRFSTLNQFFAALRREKLPTVRDELNFTLRGCQTSVARHKRLYRTAEAELARTETLDAAVSTVLKQKPADLLPLWQDVAFNSFHDILPGTSIERAHAEQLRWLAGTVHQCALHDEDALRRLSQAVDTSVAAPAKYHPCAVPLLLFNPHPFAYKGLADLSAQIDYRPVKKYEKNPDDIPLEVLGPDGEPLPFQEIALEDEAMVGWRKRVVAPVTVPPLGWAVCSVGYVENPRTAPRLKTAVAAGKDWITNGKYKIRAAAGGAGVQITADGKKLLDGAGLQCITVEDPHGSWGSDARPEGINHDIIRDKWQVAQSAVLENGPLRAVLWVRLTGGQSRLDLTFTLEHGRAAAAVGARLLWNERGARLKIVMPAKIKSADFATLGGVVHRGEMGEVPGSGWVAAQNAGGENVLGFASNLIYGFDLTRGALRASVVRSSRFAYGGGNPDRNRDPESLPWKPSTDLGEHLFDFVLTGDAAALPRLSRELQQPLLVQTALASPGKLPRTGSAGEISAAGVELLAVKPAEDGQGWIIRVQEIRGRKTSGYVRWDGGEVSLPALTPWTIATFRLQKIRGVLQIERTNILEDKLS